MSARPFCAGIGRTSGPCLSCRRRSCAHFLLVFVCYSTKQAKIRSACAEFFQKSCGSLGPKRAENTCDLFEMSKIRSDLPPAALMCTIIVLLSLPNRPRYDQTKASRGQYRLLGSACGRPFWDRSSARSWPHIPNGSGLTDLSEIADLLFSPCCGY